MPTSYCHIATHIIFGTKERYRWLDINLRDRLHAYIAAIIKQSNGIVIQIQAVEDHVHILCLMPKEKSISELLRIIKTNSSKWIHETFKKNFQWQTGYAAFSVSKSGIENVKKYIESQEEHHKKIDFQSEMNKYMEIHGFLNVDDPSA